MTDLHNDFELLGEVSCDDGLEHCEALLGSTQLAPVLARQSLKVQSRVLRKFLLAAVAHAVKKAATEQQAVIRGAVAYIGLDPWQGRPLKPRWDQASYMVDRSQRTVRSKPWRQRFINTLVSAVSDFMDDEEALTEFIKKNRPTQKITALPTPIAPLGAEENQRAPLQLTYVHRLELEAEFRSRVNSKAKLIVLVGQAGMGKTWLAEELTRDPVTGKPASFIGASKRDKFDRDLMAAFSSLGAEPPPVADTAVQLANLACAENAPRFIVLDNLDSTDDLKDLLPRHTNSVIVATCRSRGKLPMAYSHIYVDRMEQTEAEDMIRLQLPDLGDEGRRALASEFGGYPLVITHICGIFPNQTASIARLCEQLKGDARKLAAKIETEDESILLAILRRLTALVEHRDPIAFELLVVVSLAGSISSFSLEVLARYHKTFFPDGEECDAQFAYAIELLTSLSLMHVSSAGTGVTIHTFTKSVLAQEFKHHAEDVIIRLTWVITAPFGGQLPQRTQGEEYSGLENQAEADLVVLLSMWIELTQPDYWSWPLEKRVEAIKGFKERQRRRLRDGLGPHPNLGSPPAK